MKTSIIKLYDNEKYQYPMIEIKDGCIKQFSIDLDDYRKDNDEYNLEDFIKILKKQHYFIRIITNEYELFF